jgi:glutathione S-transferase
MPRLFHHPLSPASRTVRVMLAEKDIAFEPKLEKPWEGRPEFLSMSPGGDVPVLVNDDGFTLNDGLTICDYLEEIKPEPVLIGRTIEGRARVRGLAQFFNRVFARDVVDTLVVEKALKRMQGSGEPAALTIRKGYAALEEHMKYISWMAEQDKWLAGDSFSLADITAASHLSIVDYLGDIPWERFGEAKTWYARIKSRPSFRPLLADHIPGLPPPPHYANLDF